MTDLKSAVGQVLYTPLEGPVPVYWLALGICPSSGLLIVVPGDSVPLVGCCDIDMDHESMEQPLIVRVNQSVYLNADQIGMMESLYTLDPEPLRRAQEVFGDVLGCSVSPSQESVMVQEGLEYWRWEQYINDVITQLKDRLSSDS